MGAMQRNKGKSGEREVADLFKLIHERVGYVSKGTHGEEVPVGRNHSQAEKGGHDIVGVYVFAPEVKRVAKRPTEGTLEVWWTQAVEQAEEVKRLPLVVYRANHQRWKCLVPVKLPYAPEVGLSEYTMGELTWERFADYYERLLWEAGV